MERPQEFIQNKELVSNFLNVVIIKKNIKIFKTLATIKLEIKYQTEFVSEYSQLLIKIIISIGIILKIDKGKANKYLNQLGILFIKFSLLNKSLNYILKSQIKISINSSRHK